MKLPLSIIVTFCLALQTIHAQIQSDQFQYFDAKWRPIKVKKAVYLVRIRKFSDSSWQYSYYNMYGPLIRVETYLDDKASVRNGLFAWYDQDGNLDSSGYYSKGIRNGDWYNPHVADKASSYYDNGRQLSEKEFAIKLGSMAIDDPSFPDLSRQTPESYFPGGSNGWLRYLNTHLHYPQRAVDNFVKGTVLLLFTVEPTGRIDNARIKHSVEISLDDEALRLINESPNWIPAIKFDKKVRSFKVQPISFRFQFDK